jgi:hypothetical protein
MGRSSYSSRRIIEHSAAVTIQDLLSAELLGRDCNASWTHSISRNEEKLTDVHFNVTTKGDDSFLGFRYNYDGRDNDFKHRIVRQPVHLGGYRYFFECGCTKNGQYCGRRVKALYWGGHVYACRHCLDLVYLSCRAHRDAMEYSVRASALENRAKAYRRNRHPRKSNRLLWLADEYMERGNIAFCQVASKLMAKCSL